VADSLAAEVVVADAACSVAFADLPVADSQKAPLVKLLVRTNC